MNKKEFYFHQNNGAKQRSFTFCGLVDIDKGGAYLSIGMSVVNPKDQYCKKIGRAVSKARAELKPFFLFRFFEEDTKDSFEYRAYCVFVTWINGILKDVDNVVSNIDALRAFIIEQRKFYEAQTL